MTHKVLHYICMQAHLVTRSMGAWQLRSMRRLGLAAEQRRARSERVQSPRCNRWPGRCRGSKPAHRRRRSLAAAFAEPLCWGTPPSLGAGGLT